MITNIAATAIVLITMAGCAWAQTPPMQPKVTPVSIPEPVTITAPDGQPSDVPNKPLTADEAALIALRQQPDVAIARAQLGVAQGDVQQSRSALRPSLSASAGYNNGRSITGSGLRSDDFSASATIRQLIYDFNHTRDTVRQSVAREQAAAAGVTVVEADVVLAVKQAFYTYQEKQRLAEVNEAELASQQSHLASAKARLDAGMGLPADVVRAETAVANAVFNLNLARNEALVARTALAELMGIDPRTPIETAHSGESPTPDAELDQLVSQALQKRPEMRQAQLNADAADFGLKAARTSNSPSLETSLGWSGRGSDISMDSSSATIGLSVQWPLFDSGLTAGRIKSARSAQDAAVERVRSTRQEIISQVTRAYLDLKTAEQRVVTAEAQVANAEEALRLTEGRYNAGLGEFLEVLDAQTALLTARTNRVNAQSTVDRARAALVHAIGATQLSSVEG